MSLFIEKIIAALKLNDLLSWRSLDQTQLLLSFETSDMNYSIS